MRRVKPVKLRNEAPHGVPTNAEALHVKIARIYGTDRGICSKMNTRFRGRGHSGKHGLQVMGPTTVRMCADQNSEVRTEPGATLDGM